MPENKFARGKAAFFVSMGALACLLALGVSAEGQKIKKKFPPQVVVPDVDVPNGGTSSVYSAIKLVEDPNYRKFMEGVRDKIRDEVWKEAIPKLQEVLEAPDDHYIHLREKDAAGRETSRWTSVKFEANKLLGGMKEEGFEFYEIEYGGKARELLDEAKKTGDREKLARVAQCYTYTKAGIEANDLLATFFLDRGQYFMASLRLEKILDMDPSRSKLSNLTLFKAALAFRRSGDHKRADEVWKRLEAQLQLVGGGLLIRDEMVPMAQLKQIFNESVPRGAIFTSAFDWPMIRGNLENSAQAAGSQPALDYSVFPSRKTIRDVGDAGGVFAEARLEEAVKRQRAENGPVMSGFFPIVANKMVIFRSHHDIRAVALAPMKDATGRAIAAGEIVWKGGGFGFENSLVNSLDNAKLKPGLDSWLAQFNAIAGYRTILFENSLLGTINTDSKLVYAIDDLAVPAPPNVFQFNNLYQFAALKPRVMQNVLSAFDLTTGCEVWKLGRRVFEATNQATAQIMAQDEKDNPFLDSHFLSVPISVGGKLYVLNERNRGQLTGESELRLVCIDPNKVNKDTGRPHVVSVQELATVQQHARFTHDPLRRTNAAHMGYGEGVLVCTTNAGEVLGVDLLSRSLAWSYPYREQNPSTQPIQPQPFPQPFPPRNMPVSLSVANWKASPPVIQEGKVVFTAPDSTSVHCINLRDGTPVWKKKQVDGDLYLAGVFSGKVLIVGKNFIRVLKLSDGTQLWQEPTLGMPSGQGVCCKNIYYLPLRKTDRSEIVALDLERLAVKSRNPAMSSKDEIGNLLFHEGMVLSQTPLALTAYPELKLQLDLATKAVLKDPENPVNLFKRGKWLLADGQVQLAVNDLRSALIKNLPADMKEEARRKLFMAFTDLMQMNFKEASSRYLGEYRDACKVPENNQEEQERFAKFFRIVGEGFENEKNLVEAFSMYRKFGSLPINQKDGVAVLEDANHKVPISVWLRGRIANMMAAATEAERGPLDAKIAEDWTKVKAQKNIDAIRAFVDMFDVPFAVGREARLHLAETIMERDDRSAFLEAELNLQQLRSSDYVSDVNISARALTALAKLEEKKISTSPESMKMAAAYYRELKRDFPNVVLPGGKKAADLLDQLQTDPRYLHLLEEPRPLFSGDKLGVRDLREPFRGGQQQGFVFQPEGDLTPLMKQHRLLLDVATQPLQLRCYNFASNKVRWSLNVEAQFSYQVFQNLYSQTQPLANSRYNPNARFRFFQVRGNLAVIQVGIMAYCIDMDAGRILWNHSLFENPNMPNMFLQQVRTDAEGNVELVYRNQFNPNFQMTTMSVGHVGAVQASYVALVTPKGLVVLDPLRGMPLWRKLDVPIHTRVFGDDQYLFTVDDDGGAGKAYSAIDGTSKKVADFGGVYQNRVRVMGRKILAAMPNGAGNTLKLYDIVSGKDVWAKQFNPRATVLLTEDSNLTGMIEPNGQVTALEVDTGRVIFQTSVVQGLVTADDAVNLEEPWLLQDRDRYYVALNQPINQNKVAQGTIYNNFGNGLRCRAVNGWVLAFFREDGQHKENNEIVNHKKGDFHWHSSVKIENQMVILEQFESLPVLMFSSRYNEMFGPNGGRWSSFTQFVHRGNGKRLYGPGARAASLSVPFSTFCIEQKEGTVSLVGFGIGNVTIQLFVDDGRKPAPMGAGGPLKQMPRGAGLPGGNNATTIRWVREDGTAVGPDQRIDLDDVGLIPLRR